MSFASCPEPGARTPLLRHPYFAMAVLMATLFVSSGALETWEMPVAGRLAFGLLPAAAAAYLVWVMARAVRGLDELQRKVMAEALATAYTLAIVIAVALNYLHKAGIRVPLGWEDGLSILVLLYIASTLVVQRRYR